MNITKKYRSFKRKHFSKAIKNVKSVGRGVGKAYHGFQQFQESDKGKHLKRNAEETIDKIMNWKF